MSTPETRKLRRRVMTPPPPSSPDLLTGVVLSVECADDEDVEWIWTETNAGRFVSGYRIIPRVPAHNTEV